MASSSTTPLLEREFPYHADRIISPQLLRKVDQRLIPLLFITYMFNFMDKTILSSASVFGLIEDTHLVGQQYSWVSSIFYVGYLCWQWPTTLLITRLPVAKYLAANTLFWGAVLALTASCVNFGGLLVARFLLGVAEATITPAFMFITSTWYTRDEIPFRTGLWFSGNSVGGLVGSLLAYGLGHIEHPLRPWMWMFLVLGIATFLWGFVLWAFLPDSISEAKFLTREEREFMVHRAVIAGTGRTEKVGWRRDQIGECLQDPKTWHLLAIAVLTQIPNGGTQNFANLVIKSFGFTSLQSTLINVPFSIISGTTITVTGWLAGRSQRLNCILIAVVLALAGTGSTLIYLRTHHIPLGFQLLGYFLLAIGPGALPLTMSLAQTNYKGVTKKMTMTALMFVAYCAGNIIGPQLFKAKEAPAYQTSFLAILISYGSAGIMALSLRVYLHYLNTKRDREEGIHRSAGLSGAVGGKLDDHLSDELNHHSVSELVQSVILIPEDYDDVTDWNTIGFRYRL